ncbi:MAG: hypothetical protein JJT82_05845 [Legionellaceae bacterium]|nr:hypothetical protein [Legionellaceae bacterium]
MTQKSKSPLDIDKFYVSPHDYMFHAFDREHALSDSQKKEIAKHARIARLRDDADAQDQNSILWEGF